MRATARAVLAVLSLTLGIHVAAGAAEKPAAVVALERGIEADPDDAVLRYFLAYQYAGAGDTRAALAALRDALARGEGFLPTHELFASLRSLVAFGDLRKRFETRLPRVVTGHVATTLQGDALLLPEGIAHDPVERVFYVGSIARRAIYRIGAQGALTRLSRTEDGLDAVLGLAIDATARKLYAVSTSALTAAGRNMRRNAVKRYDLVTGRLDRTYAVPGAQQLNDVAIGEGFLLVTDSEGGGVWRIGVVDGAVDAIVPLGRAPGANGVAIAAYPHAYIAASRRPLHLDLDTRDVRPLRLPDHEQAAAIDGLYYRDGALIGVQNVTTPGRIIRLLLATDAITVTRVETLQSHHQPAFIEPTTAAPTDDALYVLTRTHVTRFTDAGTIRDPQTIRPAQLLRIPWPSTAACIVATSTRCVNGQGR